MSALPANPADLPPPHLSILRLVDPTARDFSAYSVLIAADPDYWPGQDEAECLDLARRLGQRAQEEFPGIGVVIRGGDVSRLDQSQGPNDIIREMVEEWVNLDTSARAQVQADALADAAALQGQSPARNALERLHGRETESGAVAGILGATAGRFSQPPLATLTATLVRPTPDGANVEVFNVEAEIIGYRQGRDRGYYADGAFQNDDPSSLTLGQAWELDAAGNRVKALDPERDLPPEQFKALEAEAWAYADRGFAPSDVGYDFQGQEFADTLADLGIFASEEDAEAYNASTDAPGAEEEAPEVELTEEEPGALVAA